ncbi:polysaccharide deacetylase family protein [Candidatus Amesbacteria bacterium]|nr:polysaccharide deacetylase family protein [Candidatus Amesbacteria bacterium]
MNKFVYITIRRLVYITSGLLDQMLGRKNLVTILCYHDIANDGWRFGVSLKTFQQQINFLHKNYSFITSKELEEFLAGKHKISQPSVLLTFDDGYAGIFQTKDFLRSLNIKPVVFVLSGKKINYPELGGVKKLLTTSQMLKLSRLGWTIGSHSSTHANFGKLSPSQIKNEISGSKSILEKTLKLKINHFAYPKGRYSNRILDAVKASGYKMAFSMNSGQIDHFTNPFLLPRVGVDRTHSFSEFISLLLPSCISIKKYLNSKLSVLDYE